MSKKARHVDFYPDEFWSGVAAKLRADEIGVYWMICTRIYSEGGPIEEDVDLLARVCRLRRPQVKAIIDRLVDVHRKLTREDGKLYQKRARTELERAAKRIATASENGAKGGRPRKIIEENQGGAKPGGFPAGKLTTNHQPPTDSSVLRTDADGAASSDQEPDPEPDEEPDLKARIFGAGLDWLAKRSSRPKDKLRSLAGKWCSLHGDGATLNAMLEAQRQSPLDPIPYIEQVLKGQGRAPPNRARGRLGMAEPASVQQLRASAPPAAEVDEIVATWGGAHEGHA